MFDLLGRGLYPKLVSKKTGAAIHFLNMAIGNVGYIDHDKDYCYDYSGKFVHHFHKRKPFAFEKEVMALIYVEENMPVFPNVKQRASVEAGLAIPVDLSVLIDKIILSPDSEGWFEQLIYNLVQNRFDVNKELIKSKLDNIPSEEI
jgi:hypothetical protein